ncbi:MAG: flippase [Patescibacteria group bacterium]|jgi:O-antigen/teichoic acid export membrane protein
MTLNKSLAQNTIVQIIGKAVSTILGLIAVAILTRNLGTEQFGWYVTATGFLQFVGILIDFGFTVTTSNLLSEPEHDKEQLFNTIFTWRFITATICFILAPLIFLFFPYRNEIKIAVAVTSLSFFANTINQVFIGFYRQKLSMFIATMSEVIGRVLLVIGFAILALNKAGFIPLMLIITLSSLGSTYYLIKNFGKIKFSIDKVISRAIFHKMWPTAISVIFNTLYLQADRVILPLYVSQSEVGLYGAAYRVLDITTQIAAIVMGLVMPLLTFAWSRKLLDEFKKRYQIGVDLLALILFPMVTGIFVLAGPIMNFIAGSEFSGSGAMLRWLCISILGTTFGMTFGHVVLAINRQKEALLIYGSDAILSVTGYLIFIPKYGWLGAVWVTIFSEIYAGIFLALMAVVYSGIMPKFGTLAKILLSSIIMGTIIFTVSWPLIPSILLGILVYTALIFLFKIIKLQSLKEIINFSKVA